ncbi:MAG: hypothetical protein A3C58_02165 [Candidatus Staskawiczbacteria bacterium RIFCSPHIGHO2_02_FULL_34_10]|uniref:Uncharacterized protein n=1 Tax=Candidatus Staskawiczbacteria bacterium RIFCSPHIGHO2_02_FULL_34_10 TaxID=1802205 RepID=A0A1G2HYG7_9BACT|nr:MAG: hypothetical protein A3C58_02165 [Candidatus Staskawiczbacteria bacterium RIFCSPHIGHO2_02_FULL_34_10]
MEEPGKPNFGENIENEGENKEVFIEGKGFFKKGQEIDVVRESGKIEKGKIFDFDDETITLTFEIGKDSMGRKKMGSKTVPREEFVKWQKVA